MSTSNLTEAPLMVKLDQEYLKASGLTDNQKNIIHAMLRENPQASPCIAAMNRRHITDRDEQLFLFTLCNWSAIDDVPDITDSGKLNFENIDCGHKGYKQLPCPYHREFCVRKLKKD